MSTVFISTPLAQHSLRLMSWWWVGGGWLLSKKKRGGGKQVMKQLTHDGLTLICFPYSVFHSKDFQKGFLFILKSIDDIMTVMLY